MRSYKLMLINFKTVTRSLFFLCFIIVIQGCGVSEEIRIVFLAE
ncbi:hypothetical protein BH23BAC3_BH23BAC3_31890 [soil metagenome]